MLSSLRLALRAAFVLSALTALVVLGVFAVFSANEPAANESADLLKLADGDGLSDNIYTLVWGGSCDSGNLAPGDICHVSEVVVRNVGASALDYDFQKYVDPPSLAGCYDVTPTGLADPSGGPPKQILPGESESFSMELTFPADAPNDCMGAKAKVGLTLVATAPEPTPTPAPAPDNTGGDSLPGPGPSIPASPPVAVLGVEIPPANNSAPEPTSGPNPAPPAREAAPGEAVETTPSDGGDRPEIVRSVGTISDISTDAKVIGTNFLLTVIMMVLILLTAAIFNETVEENSHEIEGFFARLFAPVRPLWALLQNTGASVTGGLPWLGAFAGPLIVLLLSGFTYGFLDPDFGFNEKSYFLFASLVLGIGITTYTYGGGQALVTHRQFGVPATVRVYPACLAIAVASVVLARLVDFQPGVVYGFVAAYAVLAATSFDRRQSGQIVLYPALALLGVSIAAWLLLTPLRALAEDNETGWAVLGENVAVMVFVAGLEGLFFNMIPISFMDGQRLLHWNPLAWLFLSMLSGFLFFHVLLNREQSSLDALQQAPVITAIILVSVCLALSLTTWAYFRIRVHGSQLKL